MRGSVHGFGAGASPPMQLTKEHFALQLCEIGELRRHVGRGVDRVFRLFSFFFFLFKVDRLQIILVAKKYISTCRNCSSVGCLKCVQFHNWFRLH